MNLRRVTTIVLACIMQHCFALTEQILVEKDEKNEGNHIRHNSNLSLSAVNSKLQGDSERNSISNARLGTPNRALLEKKIDIDPGRYKIRSIYGTSIYIKDNVKLVEDIEGKEVFIRSMGGKKYAIHSHEQESYMYVKGKSSNHRITTQPHAHSFELFYIISRSEDDTVVSFQSVKWDNYLKAKERGDNKDVYTSTNLGAKEKFTLIFKPSDIYTKFPQHTYRITSDLYKTNLRIPKYDDEVGMTTSNGSMERIVLRPICNPNCGKYALKSAESGERYVRMPKGYWETVGVQTRVGKNELINVIDKSKVLTGYTWTSFRQVLFMGEYDMLMSVDYDGGEELKTSTCLGPYVIFNLYME